MSDEKEDPKESKEDLLKKFKTMSKEELTQYLGITSLLNTTINVGGVFTILVMLFNPTVSMIVGGAFLLYFLASTGANTSKFQAEIKKLIEAKDK